jgi:hypothetical protein
MSSQKQRSFFPILVDGGDYMIRDVARFWFDPELCFEVRTLAE